MKICGSCGVELRCCKTGLVLHDSNYHPDSRHAADMFYCPVCKMVMINRNDGEYFSPGEFVHGVITHDHNQPILWDNEFLSKMINQYKLDLI